MGFDLKFVSVHHGISHLLRDLLFVWLGWVLIAHLVLLRKLAQNWNILDHGNIELKWRLQKVGALFLLRSFIITFAFITWLIRLISLHLWVLLLIGIWVRVRGIFPLFTSFFRQSFAKQCKKLRSFFLISLLAPCSFNRRQQGQLVLCCRLLDLLEADSGDQFPNNALQDNAMQTRVFQHEAVL